VTAGVGLHPSTGAAALAVKDGLYECIVDGLAAEDRVDVGYGFVWPAQFEDEVAVTAVRVMPGEGSLGPRQRRKVLVQVDVNLVSFRTTSDEQVTHRRAFELLALVDAAVRRDPTLGGAALWCVQGEITSDGATAEDDAGTGRVTEIAATFESQVIVTD
jgi:hypothetical protein